MFPPLGILSQSSPKEVVFKELRKAVIGMFLGAIHRLNNSVSNDELRDFFDSLSTASDDELDSFRAEIAPILSYFSQNQAHVDAQGDAMMDLVREAIADGKNREV